MGAFQWYSVAAGFFIVTTNVLMLLVILLKRQFRSQKEYVIIGANLLFDMLYGASFFLSAVWNLYLEYSNDSTLFSTLLCALFPSNLLTLLVVPASGCVVLVTTVDRFVSVVAPGRYARMRRVHMVGLMAVGFALPLPLVAINIAYASNHMNMVPAGCYPPTWGSLRALVAQLYVSATATGLALVLYLPVIHKVYKLYKCRNEYAKVSRHERLRILRTTTTFILIMGSHVVFLMVPDAIIAHVPSQFREALIYLRLTKGIVDILIYLLTQHDLRRALFSPHHRSTSVIEITKVQTTRDSNQKKPACI